MIFKKNFLTKRYMTDKYYKYNREDVYSNKKNFEEFICNIEKEFYTHQFDTDDRYICIGRQRFLIDEMEELYYTKEQCKQKNFNKCPTVWCLDSLIELITQHNFLTINDYNSLVGINDIYKDKSVNECREIYESYNQNDIISLNERDIILHAINMIKDSLKKCNENLEWK